MTAQPSLAQDALQLYPYGSSGRQRFKRSTMNSWWSTHHFGTISCSLQ